MLAGLVGRVAVEHERERSARAVECRDLVAWEHAEPQRTAAENVSRSGRYGRCGEPLGLDDVVELVDLDKSRILGHNN